MAAKIQKHDINGGTAISENETNGCAHQVASEATGTEMAPVPVSAQRQRLGELAQQLAQAAQRKRALRAKVETMSRAQQAAQGEAMKARQQWSAKLRDSDGTLARDIQKLSAAERSALSLAEEYQAMQSEIASELPRVELELATIASDCRSGKDSIAKEAADVAYDHLLVEAGQQLAVTLSLFSTAENGGVERHQRLDAAELTNRFFGRLAQSIRSRLDDPAVMDEVKMRMNLPEMEMESVDVKLAASSAVMSILKRRCRVDAIEGRPQDR